MAQYILYWSLGDSTVGRPLDIAESTATHSSSSQYCAGQRLAPHNRTLGDLEWEVESTTVTHSSADWWDLLLPLA